MPENYARETNVKKAEDCCREKRNCKKSAGATDVKMPMSKQSAAERKISDCNR